MTINKGSNFKYKLKRYFSDTPLTYEINGIKFSIKDIDDNVRKHIIEVFSDEFDKRFLEIINKYNIKLNELIIPKIIDGDYDRYAAPSSINFMNDRIVLVIRPNVVNYAWSQSSETDWYHVTYDNIEEYVRDLLIHEVFYYVDFIKNYLSEFKPIKYLSHDGWFEDNYSPKGDKNSYRRLHAKSDLKLKKLPDGRVLGCFSSLNDFYKLYKNRVSNYIKNNLKSQDEYLASFVLH